MHLVGYFYMIYTMMHGSMNITFIIYILLDLYFILLKLFRKVLYRIMFELRLYFSSTLISTNFSESLKMSCVTKFRKFMIFSICRT